MHNFGNELNFLDSLFVYIFIYNGIEQTLVNKRGL